MNFPTIGDVKHIKADMTDMERHELILQSRRLQQIRELGDKWLGSIDYSGHYIPALTSKQLH